MRLLVDPPSTLPSPYGLLSVADMRSESNVHWQAGVTWRSNCGGADTTYDECITSAPNASGIPSGKGANAIFDGRGATPFTVYTEIDCSPVDFYENADATATAALLGFESYLVEQAFWNGTIDGVANVALPHLAADAAIIENGLYPITLQPASDVVTGVGFDPVCALAALELEMAKCTNGVGYIHMPIGAVPVFASRVLISRDGNRLRTSNGNIVIAGNGYPGTGPDGSMPPIGAAWIYGTGSVFGYRSTPRLLGAPGSIDRTTNTIHAIAERTYVMAFDCCLFAIPVCITCTICDVEPNEVRPPT
jgi:hypothetical protein